MDCAKGKTSSSCNQIPMASPEEENHDAPLYYYVSSAWLEKWLNKEEVSFPSKTDMGPTASLRCSHGGLVLETSARIRIDRHLLVPEMLWNRLRDDFIKVKRDDWGCLAYPSSAKACERCKKAIKEVNECKSM